MGLSRGELDGLLRSNGGYDEVVRNVDCPKCKGKNGKVNPNCWMCEGKGSVRKVTYEEKWRFGPFDALFDNS